MNHSAIGPIDKREVAINKKGHPENEFRMTFMCVKWVTK
jgi:hypothetical protein